MIELLEAALAGRGIGATDIHTTTMNMCRVTLVFSHGVQVTMFALSPINFGEMTYGDLCKLCTHIQAIGTHLGFDPDEFIYAKGVEAGPVACIPGSKVETLYDMRRTMSAVVEGVGSRSRTSLKSNTVLVGYVGLAYTDAESWRPAESYSDAMRSDVPILVFVTDSMSSHISVRKAREDILYAQTQDAYGGEYLKNYFVYGASKATSIRSKYFTSLWWYHTTIRVILSGKWQVLSRVIRSVPYTPVIHTRKPKK